MGGDYVNLTVGNLDAEHACCAIADKKYQDGVAAKKQWLKERIREGHVFRKLNERGKVFIEYAPLESSWVPVCGENYIYLLPVGGRLIQRQRARAGSHRVLHR
ncbi:hypothetical protein [Pyramidobacter porci]|uniref:hypothetical protein n=1 Tax=Pyramidobacter porci TaxID=2605789 RepID=UPI002A75BD5E|nr:hypothetical protein [Pyramidobacter porci]